MKAERNNSDQLEVIHENEPSQAVLEEFYQAVVRGVRKAVAEGRKPPDWLRPKE